MQKTSISEKNYPWMSWMRTSKELPRTTKETLFFQEQ